MSDNSEKMTTVYLVRAFLKHDDGEAILGVFKTEKSAEKKRLEVELSRQYVSPYVDERDVEE